MGEPWLLITDEKFVKTVMMANRDPFPRVRKDAEFVLPVSGIGGCHIM